MEHIKLKHISKVYSMGSETVPVLSDLSFTVAQGEFIAICGPSGYGKSTLLHIIGGLNRPSSGEVYIHGKFLYEKRGGAGCRGKPYFTGTAGSQDSRWRTG